MVALLMEHGLVTDISSLYQLTADRLESLPRMGALSSRNLIAAIEKSKDIPLARFIFALGIRHVGERTAQSLADHCGELSKFLSLTVDELVAIPDIGEETAITIAEYLADPAERELIDRLISLGLRIVPSSPPQTTTHGPLAGLTFVITGTLPSLSRSEAEQFIRNNGGTVSSSVSKRTSYVLAGTDPGSKIKKAQDLGVEIIDEEMLRQMMG
jgi:DNA ligase (NAD+)